MSFALKDLRKILGGTTSIQGTVIEVGSTGVSVATPNGVVVVQPSIISVKKNDRVLISDGMLHKIPKVSAIYSV